MYRYLQDYKEVSSGSYEQRRWGILIRTWQMILALHFDDIYQHSLFYREHNEAFDRRCEDQSLITHQSAMEVSEGNRALNNSPHFASNTFNLSNLICRGSTDLSLLTSQNWETINT